LRFARRDSGSDDWAADDLRVADRRASGEHEAVGDLVDESSGVEFVDGVFDDHRAADLKREHVSGPGRCTSSPSMRSRTVWAVACSARLSSCVGVGRAWGGIAPYEPLRESCRRWSDQPSGAHHGAWKARTPALLLMAGVRTTNLWWTGSDNSRTSVLARPSSRWWRRRESNPRP
jgi:hypothetical protein